VYTHAAAVGAIAQREGIPYLLDATQSIGQMPIDVQQLQCDYLTSTGRKFLRAPRGTGLLYASRYSFIPSFIHSFVHSDMCLPLGLRTHSQSGS